MPHRVTPAAKHAGREVSRARAAAKAAAIAPIIKRLQAKGITSFGGIAAALSARGVPTAAGGRRWYATQVRRAMKRLAG
jgi:hypothetical protein